MNRFRMVVFGGAIVLAAALGFNAWAHGGATGVVKERMDNMMMLGDALKALTEMFQGKSPYNVDKVRQNADMIRAHSGAVLVATFPKGTNAAPSEAKSEIWQNWESFTALADQLETFAEGLSLAAANPAGARGGMMGGGGMMSGGSAIMGSGPMMAAGAGPTAEALGQMPPDRVFGMLVQNCSACHTKFRAEEN